MRFDDMLATVLAQPRLSDAARIAALRQIVDILAQRGDEPPTTLSERAYALLGETRESIPAAVRREAARAIGGRRVPAELVAWFAADRPEIAAPLLAAARLDSREWIALLPSMASAARALLRHRRDLEPEVAAALASFGAADLILEGGVATALETSPNDEMPEDEGEQQIARLVERIEAFRRDREIAPVAKAAASDRIDSFRFETGHDGVFRWIEGAPRGPLIGQSLAFSADAPQHGVDGHAAGAFRRRAPFRDARLTVAGEGEAAGSWRISAVPFFSDTDGRFTGYRGTARRPRRDEEASVVAPAPAGLFGSNLAPDSLRQLVHELRTPINAIIGFAEMIERQLLGPVSAGYREWAGEIVGEASRLLASVEDLDAAARFETGRMALDPKAIDGAALLRRLHDEYAPVAEARGVAFLVRLERELPLLATDPVAADRMFARLLAATIGLARQGETVTAALATDQRNPGMVRLSVTRPATLAAASERQLLDPGYSPEGEWPEAPALGLGFALRLVRNIAREADGSLDIAPRNFILRLPASDASALSGEQGR